MPEREDWSAAQWEEFLNENPDQVVLFIDENHEIHQFEWDEGQLCFVRGGTYGYDYEGSRAALEAFADGSGAFKVVPRDDVRVERQSLIDGEYETPTEWAEA